MDLVITSSSEETKAFGKKLAACLKPGSILALSGELGAGKTTLVQGIAQGLGVTDYVASPSFTLINEYHGKLPLFHIDLYRLENLAEIDDLGLEEYFDRPGTITIEWAEKMKKLLPDQTKWIKIEVKDENTRHIFCD